MKERIKNFLHELLDKKVSKKHIEEEWERHLEVAKKSVEYFFTFLALITIYVFFTYEVLIVDLVAASLFILFISNFMPDIFYIVWKILRNDKSYIPSIKRIYSHRSIGLITYTFSIFMLFNLFFDIKFSLAAAFFAFVGYWSHLATDRVELFVDYLKDFFEKIIKED
jgi:small-conductance mechanosensitive channel